MLKPLPGSAGCSGTTASGCLQPCRCYLRSTRRGRSWAHENVHFHALSLRAHPGNGPIPDRLPLPRHTIPGPPPPPAVLCCRILSAGPLMPTTDPAPSGSACGVESCLGPNPSCDTHMLCDTEQVALLLWASISSSVKWGLQWQLPFQGCRCS